jgi:integrase
MYFKHGRFWYVKRGTWHDLGTVRRDAFTEYERLTSDSKQGTMPALIDRAYAAHIVGKAQGTAVAYATCRDRLKKVFAQFEPHEVKPKHVAQLRLADAKTPNQANRNQSFLKIVFDFALEQGIVDVNPVAGARRLKQGKRDRYITDAEFLAIRPHAVPRMQCLMDICFFTGQRIGDVLRIRYDDLQPEGLSFKQQKTGARLVVRWSPGLTAAIAMAKALDSAGRVVSIDRGWLFKGRTAAKPLTYKSAQRDWNQACAAAGVEDAHLHDLRAKGATDVKRQGGDATALLGHSSAKQTEVYIRAREIPVVTGPSFGRV